MQKETLTVGFADLANFARLIKAVGSEKALEVLQEGFKFVGDAILAHNGKIRKYIGDTTLFTFEDPKEAITTAKEIAQGFNREIDGVPIRYNVGLATGEVFVREVGHPSYLVEDVMGSVVNQAATLIREASKSKSGLALCSATLEHE